MEQTEITSGVKLRAVDIAEFLGVPQVLAEESLALGFGVLHGQVADDFRRANPNNDEELLKWYRETYAYIWELSAYHLDAGFNYAGMMGGIEQRLATLEVVNVLVLGDGVGDLSLYLWLKGYSAVYHDLAGSKTAEFAAFRFSKHAHEEQPRILTDGWSPDFQGQTFDAVIALDFLEHVTDVPQWTRAIYDALRPGGVFIAQNAFGIGSGASGSIPCHLERNDRFENDWRPLVESTGFTDMGGNWWQKTEWPVK